jgi:hypothetical protein
MQVRRLLDAIKLRRIHSVKKTRPLADISNDNDNENNENPQGTTHQSKRQKTHNPTPTGSDDEDTSGCEGQLEDEFVSNMPVGHKFLCYLCSLGLQRCRLVFSRFSDRTWWEMFSFSNITHTLV